LGINVIVFFVAAFLVAVRQGKRTLVNVKRKVAHPGKGVTLKKRTL